MALKNEGSINKILLHLHPRTVSPEAIKYNRTFALGGMATFLLFILFVTGLMLKFAYVPSVAGAYDSIKTLQEKTLLGSFLRNIHYWSAMLLVVVTFLHLVRTFYSMSIYKERAKNWQYGLILLFLVVASNFTGYLLLWDQLSYWAVTIISNMLDYFPVFGDSISALLTGGETISENTLLRFYHFHTGILPILIVFFTSVHIWLVRKAGGVALPTDRIINKKVSTSPNLVFKEIVVALSLLLLLMFFSVFVDAPLLDKAKPMLSPNPTKAPWYFMGFQELLMHIHPVIATFVLPILVGTFLFGLPYIAPNDANTGTWFNSKEGKKSTLLAASFSFVLTFSWVLINDKILDPAKYSATWSGLLRAGWIQSLLYLIPVFLFLLWTYRKITQKRIEIVMAIVTIIFVSYLTMMLVGSLLRGEGMQLIF